MAPTNLPANKRYATYKLDTAVRRHITQAAEDLATRKIDLLRTGCPLSIEQVQGLVFDVFEGPATRAEVEQLRSRVAGRLDFKVPVHDAGHVQFIGPGLMRPVRLHLSLAKPVYWRCDSRYIPTFADPDWSMGNTYLTTVDLGDPQISARVTQLLGTQGRAKFLTWMNALLRAERHKRLVLDAVTATLGEAAHTGHLAQLWPHLTRLVQVEPWRTRFLMLPNPRSPYPTSGAWRAQWGALVAACDGVLLEGTMLDRINVVPGRFQTEQNMPVIGTLAGWRPRPGDREHKG